MRDAAPEVAAAGSDEAARQIGHAIYNGVYNRLATDLEREAPRL